jgi:hypothetical protein
MNTADVGDRKIDIQEYSTLCENEDEECIVT